MSRNLTDPSIDELNEARKLQGFRSPSAQESQCPQGPGKIRWHDIEAFGEGLSWSKGCRSTTFSLLDIGAALGCMACCCGVFGKTI